jgi:hypothetical protein
VRARDALNNLRRWQTNNEASYVYRTACLAALGETSEAKSTLDQLRGINSGVSLEWAAVAYPYRCYQDNESTQRLVELLSIAGLR